MLHTPSPRQMPNPPVPPLPLPELYSRVERHVPPFEWRILADDIAGILKLKREKNAVILVHNYQTPDIFHTVADIVGDSLALAREAVRTDAEIIVLAGVHFMAETAKLLNPEKTVLIPDLEAGCSLASSISAEDVRLLRASHPGVPIVTYVNTSAAVKAESDICCTSGNAKKIVEVELKQKGTPLHAATVVGDTVGDPFKDTSSVALNPIIKFTTLFGLLAVELAVSLTRDKGASLTRVLAAVFFIISVAFVLRSFYGMRVKSAAAA